MNVKTFKNIAKQKHDLLRSMSLTGDGADLLRFYLLGYCLESLLIYRILRLSGYQDNAPVPSYVVLSGGKYFLRRRNIPGTISLDHHNLVQLARIAGKGLRIAPSGVPDPFKKCFAQPSAAVASTSGETRLNLGYQFLALWNVALRYSFVNGVGGIDIAEENMRLIKNRYQGSVEGTHGNWDSQKIFLPETVQSYNGDLTMYLDELFAVV